MKILLIANSYLPKLGGLEIVVFNISAHLTRRGFQVEIVAGVDGLCMSSTVEDNIYVHRVPFVLPRILFRLGKKRLWQSFLQSILFPFLFPIVLLKMVNIYMKFRPNIVNLHYIGNNSLYALALRKIFEFPLVVNIHGNDIEGVGNRLRVARYFTTKTLEKADFILSNSYHLLREAEKIVPGITAKSKVVGNGLEISEFENAEPYSYEKKYLLSISNFVYKKGQDILIRAYGKAREMFGGELPDLLLVGDGPELEKCKRLAKELSLEGNVKFLGRINPRDIPGLLKRCEFFVHPARKEPFGIVILEAMASGKAIVSTRVGGIPEIIKGNRVGILVEPESAEELARGIVRLVENPGLAEKFGKKGEKLAREHSWERVVDKYVEAYNSIVIGKNRKKYSVLLVTPNLDIGGEELSTLSLAKGLVKRGHIVHILSSGGPLLPEFISNSIDVTIGPVDGRGLREIIRGALFMRKFVKKYNVQIIHTQSAIPALKSWLGCLFAMRRRPVLIWHDRGIQERNYPIVGRLFNFMVDFVIANSDYEREKLIANGLNGKKVRRVHNCFNISFPENTEKDLVLLKELNLPQDQLIIGTVRRLHPEKGGHHTLLKAALMVLRSFPNGVKFLIVGDGPLRSELVEFCRQVGIESNVIFTGFRRDVERFYSIMDIFVLPSTWEPFGNVLLEAMSFAKPVVATNVGGIPEVVVDEETGFVVPPEDPEALANKIMFLIKNKELCREMGLKGRNKVKEYFTPERLRDEVESVYESLVG
jgi:glycosyltransferase involved in cell wall biosynthesis